MIVSLLKEILLGLVIFQNHRVQPIVRETMFGLGKELNIFNMLKELSIGSSSRTFVGNVFIQMLQLCTSECSINIRHTVIIADMVVTELPTMRYLSLGCEVFGQCGQLLIIEQ